MARPILIHNVSEHDFVHQMVKKIVMWKVLKMSWTKAFIQSILYKNHDQKRQPLDVDNQSNFFFELLRISLHSRDFTTDNLVILI